MARPKIKRKGADWKELVGGDRDLIKAAVQDIVQEVLEAEMEEIVGARKGERTAERTGYRSGYYTRSLVTRVGKLELRFPQDRAGRFSTEVFERYQRSEKALVSSGDVRPRRIDAKGQGDHGRTVRTFFFRQQHQPN